LETAPSIARALRRSPIGSASRHAHLRRLFVEHLGATPIDVALTRRVHSAKRLLDETHLLLDRKAFLQQTAKPVAIRNLEAHGIHVRLMGDIAIIHARTSYTALDSVHGGGRYTDVLRPQKW
jgi:AraC-like DNA-binding protein